MDRYSPGITEDYALVGLWLSLMQSNDMLAYPAELQLLSVFFQRMQAPNVLLTERDDEGIWFAFWHQPQPLPYTLVHLWIREDKRQAPSALKAADLALTHTFNEHPAVIAYCSDENVGKLYEAFGLVHHTPTVPIGYKLGIYSLDRDTFEARKKKRA